jgi:hypothetical protein
VSDAAEKDQGAREAEGSKSMSKVSESKERKEFVEEFNEWMKKLEEQKASTRRSELLTQEDYAIQINAQG